MPDIIIYRTRFCPYCIGAVRLLNRKDVEFEEISVDNDADMYETMIEKSDRTSVPQIFMGDFHVGGFDDLAVLEQSGELDEILSA